MRFSSPYQQGPAQIALLRQLHAKADLTFKQLLMVCAESAAQGLAVFPLQIAKLDDHERSDVQRFVRKARGTWQAVRGIPGFEGALRDPELFRKLYALDEPYFEKGSAEPRTLLIIFTTMYNNFHISNLALLMMLRGLGVSILILKDASRFNYLRGIPGFGTDYPSSCAALGAFIAEHGIDRTYISGFSASGFASLLTTTFVRCDGYLGFSIRTEIVDRPGFDAGKFFTAEVRDLIPMSLHVDLAPLIRRIDPPMPCRLIYGSNEATDTGQAQNLAGIPGVNLQALENCGHRSVERLVINGALLAEFRSLVALGDDHVH